MTTYWYLFQVIATGFIGTSALKSAEEFTKLVPSVIVVVIHLFSKTSMH